MVKQLEATDPQTKRRGFFDRPAGVDFWMNVGGRFWGGTVIGISFGLFVGANLVKLELLRPDTGLWLITLILVLMGIGLAITHRAVGRSSEAAAAARKAASHGDSTGAQPPAGGDSDRAEPDACT